MNFPTGQSCNSPARVPPFRHPRRHAAGDRRPRSQLKAASDRPENEVGCLSNQASSQDESYIKLGGTARSSAGRPADPKLARDFSSSRPSSASPTHAHRPREIFVRLSIFAGDENDMLELNALTSATCSSGPTNLDRATVCIEVEPLCGSMPRPALSGCPSAYKQSASGARSHQELLACTQIKNVNLTLRRTE